ncbi:MAG TPA: ABC transporter ATP-binding protein [Vicinamibacterales bacterium]|jgi:drug efflux transport system ATP-binding protein|nr:ABC transporter ATP-binding protein [Vicinamibacterales bacterium]
MEPAIAFDRVTKQYGRLKAVDAVSFTIARGEMFGLIGPDGAGKTTSIRMACGLLRPDSGQIRVIDRDPIKQHRAVTADLGYLSQRFSLYGDLSIDENIAFFAEIHGVRRYQESRDRLLEMTQLGPFRTRRADRLSGGMKQKLALACTLVHEPKVLLLDEPTTGVDPVSRREFWKLLSEFLSRGLTIVMSTPYLDEAERCGRVALLHDGHLLAVDHPGRLQARLEGQLLEVSVRDGRPPLDLLRSLPGIADVQSFGDRAHVRIRDHRDAASVSVIAKELERHGSSGISVRPIAASLEDVFIDLITGPGQQAAHSELSRES